MKDTPYTTVHVSKETATLLDKLRSTIEPDEYGRRVPKGRLIDKLIRDALAARRD